jgi:anti-sigma B factor antagonist
MLRGCAAVVVTFNVDIVHSRGHVVLEVDGEVDGATAAELQSKLAEAIAVSPQLVLDLSKTTFMDSAGLTTLVQARRACVDSGGSVTIRSPQQNVRRVLQITQLDSIISIED